MNTRRTRNPLVYVCISSKWVFTIFPIVFGFTFIILLFIMCVFCSFKSFPSVDKKCMISLFFFPRSFQLCTFLRHHASCFNFILWVCVVENAISVQMNRILYVHKNLFALYSAHIHSMDKLKQSYIWIQSNIAIYILLTMKNNPLKLLLRWFWLNSNLQLICCCCFLFVCIVFFVVFVFVFGIPFWFSCILYEKNLAFIMRYSRLWNFYDTQM